MTSAPDFAYWLACAPTFGGDFDLDRARLELYFRDGVELVAALPPGAARNAQHRLIARYIDEECRDVRSSFLAHHSGEIHRRIARRHAAPRMSDILRTGSVLFPELVPSEMQTPAGPESELDRALFISALLLDVDTGPLVVDAMRVPTRRARLLLDEFRRTGDVDLGRARVRRVASVAHVSLTNPGAGNAEDDASVADLEVAVDLALLHDDVLVAVLRGGPVGRPEGGICRVFSAGVDVAGIRRGAVTLSGSVLRREFGVFAKVARGLVTPERDASIRKPWVAAVDTAAIGCGAETLTVFDRVLVASDAHADVPLYDERLAGGYRWNAYEMAARNLADEVVEPDDMDRAVQRATADLERGAARGEAGMADDPDLGQLARLVQAQARWLDRHASVSETDREMAARHVPRAVLQVGPGGVG